MITCTFDFSFPSNKPLQGLPACLASQLDKGCGGGHHGPLLTEPPGERDSLPDSSQVLFGGRGSEAPEADINVRDIVELPGQSLPQRGPAVPLEVPNNKEAAANVHT